VFFNKNKRINISYKNRLIFIHIPKCGGTSLARSLGFNFSTYHTTIVEAKERINPLLYKYFFKFAVIREPIDRFVSLYSYAKMPVSLYHDNINDNPNKKPHLDYALLKDASINDCVDYLLEGKLKHEVKWGLQWLPQTNWIEDKNGNILVDYLGCFNRLQEDFMYIKNKLKLKSNLSNLNKSERKKDIKSMLTPKNISILEEYYAKDLITFTKFTASKEGLQFLIRNVLMIFMKIRISHKEVLSCTMVILQIQAT